LSPASGRNKKRQKTVVAPHPEARRRVTPLGFWGTSRLLGRLVAFETPRRGDSAGIALPETMTKKRNFVAGFRTK
jgi:hypothetical protein